jgi:zinc/manganese transport system permease protein
MLSFVAICILSVSACPIGVYLMLRRMSLTGDAMSHAILPGVGIASLFAGAGLMATLLGGILAGLLVALLASLTARLTILKEDSSLTVFYLVSLASGVWLLKSQGSDEDVLHQLFGSIDAIDRAQLLLVGAAATLTLFALALLWRPLMAECLDPGFLRSVKGRGGIAVHALLALAVVNLVAGFQTMGALLAVAIMMLPAIAARFWVRDIDRLCLVAIAIGCASGSAGLTFARIFAGEPGPAITLAGGLAVIVSAALGPLGPLRQSRNRITHRIL